MRIPDELWEQHRAVMSDKYQAMTLKQVMDSMKEEYGFHAT